MLLVPLLRQTTDHKNGEQRYHQASIICHNDALAQELLGDITTPTFKKYKMRKKSPQEKQSTTNIENATNKRQLAETGADAANACTNKFGMTSQEHGQYNDLHHLNQNPRFRQLSYQIHQQRLEKEARQEEEEYKRASITEQQDRARMSRSQQLLSLRGRTKKRRKDKYIGIDSRLQDEGASEEEDVENEEHFENKVLGQFLKNHTTIVHQQIAPVVEREKQRSQKAKEHLYNQWSEQVYLPIQRSVLTNYFGTGSKDNRRLLSGLASSPSRGAGVGRSVTDDTSGSFTERRRFRLQQYDEYLASTNSGTKLSNTMTTGPQRRPPKPLRFDARPHYMQPLCEQQYLHEIQERTILNRTKDNPLRLLYKAVPLTEDPTKNRYAKETLSQGVSENKSECCDSNTRPRLLLSGGGCPKQSLARSSSKVTLAALDMETEQLKNNTSVISAATGRSCQDTRGGSRKNKSSTLNPYSVVNWPALKDSSAVRYDNDDSRIHQLDRPLKTGTRKFERDQSRVPMDHYDFPRLTFQDRATGTLHPEAVGLLRNEKRIFLSSPHRQKAKIQTDVNDKPELVSGKCCLGKRTGIECRDTTLEKFLYSC